MRCQLPWRNIIGNRDGNENKAKYALSMISRAKSPRKVKQCEEPEKGKTMHRYVNEVNPEVFKHLDTTLGDECFFAPQQCTFVGSPIQDTLCAKPRERYILKNA